MIAAMTRNIVIRIGAHPSSLHTIKRNASSSAKPISPELKRLVKYWWDDEGAYIHLHRLNRLLLPQIRECLMKTGRIDRSKIESSFVSKPFTGVSFLVVGCNAGILCEPLSVSGAQVVGIDPSKEKIAVAKNHSQANNADVIYSCATLEQYAQDNFKLFDVVVLSDIIEQLDRQSHEKFINKAIELIKPKGSLLITTMNYTPEAVYYCMLEKYFVHAFPVGLYDSKKFIRHNILVGILEDNNMDIWIKGIDWCQNDKRWKEINRFDLRLFVHAKKR